MSETKDISPHTYAKWWGHHVSYVHRLLLAGRVNDLPGVIEVKKYSRFYTLMVNKGLTKDSFKIIKPKNKS